MQIILFDLCVQRERDQLVIEPGSLEDSIVESKLLRNHTSSNIRIKPRCNYFSAPIYEFRGRSVPNLKYFVLQAGNAIGIQMTTDRPSNLNMGNTN